MVKKIVTLTLITFSFYGCASLSSKSQSSNDEVKSEVNQALASGNIESALITVNQAIKDQPDNAWLFTTRAQINMSLKQTAAANADYQSALKITPLDSVLLDQYANFLCQQKYFNDANITFKSAMQQAESAFVPQIYTDWATCLANNQQTDEAINKYINALSFDNAPYKAYAGISSIYLEQKNYPTANYYINLYHGAPRPDDLYFKITILQLLDKNILKTNEQKKVELQLAQLKAQLFKQFPDSNEAKSLNMINKVAKNKAPEPVITQAATISSANKEMENSDSRIKQDSDGRSYIVIMKNDTVYSLSRKTNVSIEKLTKSNNLKQNNLVLGTKLYLPTK